MRLYSGMLITTLLASSLVACGGKADARNAVAAGDVVAVRTAPVEYTTLRDPVVATGTVGPRDQITLSFKIGGIVQAINAREGDVVRAGQTLATLDLREIDAQVSKAKSAADKADRDLSRARSLYRDSVATLSQVEDATTAAEVAHADLSAASVNRRYAVIVAPSAGPILRRAVEPGELVSPGAPVLVLASTASGIVLRVGLSDRDVVRVRVGDRATVHLDAFPNRVINGTVRQIGAAASSQTGTYSVEVALDDPNGLAAGMAGRVEIAAAHGAPTALVPVQSILEADGDRASIFALDSTGHARRIHVEIGALQNGRVPVRRGLESVSAVVTDGASYLDNGVKVRIVP